MTITEAIQRFESANDRWADCLAGPDASLQELYKNEVQDAEKLVVALCTLVGSPSHVACNGRVYKVRYAGVCMGLWDLFAKPAEMLDQDLARQRQRMRPLVATG